MGDKVSAILLSGAYFVLFYPNECNGSNAPMERTDV